MDAVSYSARASGLLPLWLFAALCLLLLLSLVLAFRERGRYPTLLAEIAAVGTIFGAFVLFFWRPLLTPDQVPVGGGDLNSFFYPLHSFTADRINAGDVPLWNPALHGGMPQLANFQAGLLYPPNVLAWLLARPFSYGTLEALALAHYLMASVGIYVLARSLRLGIWPALLAAVVFPYSGFLVAHLGHYSMLAAAVWLPWLLLTTRLQAIRASWFWAGFSALIVFLATSAGHQQTLLYLLATTGIWWLFWVCRRAGWVPGESQSTPWQWPTEVSRHWLLPLSGDALRFALAVITGLGLAAPMILTSLELAGKSVRSALSYEQATEFSIQPVALLHFVLPKVFGSNPTDYWGPFSSGEIWGYVGVVTLIMAGIGLAIRSTPVRLLLAGLAALALLYAMGPWVPLHGWIFRFVPPFDLLRAPARVFLILDLCLALLAAYGLFELIRRHGRSERLPLVLGGANRMLLVVLAALVLFILPLFYSLILGTNDPSNRPVIALDGLMLLTIYLAGAAVLLWAVRRRKLPPGLIAPLVILLVVLDLFGATSSFNPTSDDLTAGFNHPEMVGFLSTRMTEDGPFRIDSASARWQPNLAAVAGLHDIGGVFDPMQPADYARARDRATADRSLPAYDLLNARFLVTEEDAAPPGAGFVEAFRSGDGLVVWENQDVVPRVYLAYEGIAAEQDLALERVLAADFDPERDLYISGLVFPAVPGGTGNARIIDYQPDEVRIQVESDRLGFLVLNDLFYPGWQATVNGNETPIAIANGLFRVVTVPAGASEVVFQFEPPLARMGFGVSIVSGLLLVAMLALGFVRGRSTQILRR